MKRPVEDLEIFSNVIRRRCLSMALSAGNAGCHVGGGFSSIEILAVLFGVVLNVAPKNPLDEDRDRFLASKAHCILPHFSALVEMGFVPESELMSFCQDGGLLAGHPWSPSIGLEFSGGSLGMGLSIGIGMALAARLDKKKYTTYVLLGDGESNEGAVWEGIMTAAHYKLDNLVAILDFNKLQFDGPVSSIMGLEPIESKFSAFGWEVRRVDGHDVHALLDSLRTHHEGKPLAIIADTIKARGIPGLENKAESHHAVMTKEMRDAVLRDMEDGKYGRV